MTTSPTTTYGSRKWWFVSVLSDGSCDDLSEDCETVVALDAMVALGESHHFRIFDA